MKPLQQAVTLLGTEVLVVVDRQLGTKHPRFIWHYPINYGELVEYQMPDSGGLDAYILGIEHPVAEFTGKVIAVISRVDDLDDPKLVVANKAFSKSKIAELVAFQEQYFEHFIYMQ